jgi:hypothetical protein
MSEAKSNSFKTTTNEPAPAGFLFGGCHDKATARKFGGSSADPLPVMVMPDSMAMMIIAVVMVIGECRDCGGECRDSDYDGHGDLFHSFALGKDGIR